MKIYLENHNHRYAVEQTVMALLPDHSIETVETEPVAVPRLVSTLEVGNQGKQGLARCILVLPSEENLPISGEKKREVISEETPQPFSTHNPQTPSQEPSETSTEKPTQEWVGECAFSLEEEGRKQAEQYAVKSAIYNAVVQYLPSPPPWGSLTGVRPVKMATKWLKQAEEKGKSEEISVDSPEEQAKNILQQTFHVGEVRRTLAVECAVVSRKIQALLCQPSRSISLYVGIPFCPSRCAYCSFFSSDVREHEQKLEPYLTGLILELEKTAELLEETGQTLSTVYVGGGTPTVLPPVLLDKLLAVIHKRFITNGIEFTVEAGRPDTLTTEKLDILQQHKVTRISINPQTMDDKLLHQLKRNHTAQDIVDIYQKAQGRFQINMDLISGLPNDNQENILKSIQEVINLRPTQITVHSLTPKRNTLLATLQQPKTLDLQEILDSSWQHLREQGYKPYYLYRQKKIAGGLENVGWTLPDDRGESLGCLYNVAMMEEFSSILSCGSGGMTKFVSKNKIIRQANPKYYWEYLDKLELCIQSKAQLLRQWLEEESTSNIK